jgi:hypothetical protein
VGAAVANAVDTATGFATVAANYYYRTAKGTTAAIATVLFHCYYNW